MVGLGHRKSDAFHHEAGEPHQWRTGGQSAENEKFHSHIGTSATSGRFIDRRTHKTPSQPVSISIAQDRTMYNPNAFRRTHDKILKAIGAKHIRHTVPEKRGGRENAVRRAGSLFGRVHAEHLHPRHNPNETGRCRHHRRRHQPADALKKTGPVLSEPFPVWANV